MTKRARRRANKNYSHSEPLVDFDREANRAFVVGFADVGGDGRTLSTHSTKRFEIKPSRRLAPPKHERNEDIED